ncbi:MAG: hypothetical protein QNJ91_16175 [Gammaproteobacteria bacterium]|nr:hypothetical protein [Gammaproteobacteria bacterium]
MPDAKRLFTPLLGTALLASPAATFAYAEPIATPIFNAQRITCEAPVRLAHDCSIWSGATRPIAFGQYRMRLAAGDDGRTILVSQLRPGPDHNGQAFLEPWSSPTTGTRALRLLGSALEDQGIRLQRLQALRQGRRIKAWVLEFSGNAYDYLKRFTVLESEYWLPARRR